MIRVETITFPAHWAPYLINGDASSLDDGEAKRIDDYLRDNLQGSVVSDVEESERFTWHYRLYGGEAGGGTVIDYVCHVIEYEPDPDKTPFREGLNHL